MSAWEQFHQDPTGGKVLLAGHIQSAVATTPTKGLPMTTSLLGGGVAVP